MQGRAPPPSTPLATEVPAGTVRPSIAAQRAFWNAWDREFREERGLDSDSLRRAREVLARVGAQARPGATILEVGCANGWLSKELARFGRVTATDLADEVVAAAASRYPDIRFLAGDFLKLELPERFDFAISLETLAFIEDQPAFVARLAALLKPGGTLILTTHSRFVYERRSDVAPLRTGQFRAWTTRRQLRVLLERHFRIRELRTIIPGGDRGILKLFSSFKVNSLMTRLIGARAWLALKERLGTGITILTVAERR